MPAAVLVRAKVIHAAKVRGGGKHRKPTGWIRSDVTNLEWAIAAGLAGVA